jgi:exopolysaccharide production protein ExoQ
MTTAAIDLQQAGSDRGEAAPAGLAESRAVMWGRWLLFALVFVNEANFRLADGTQFGLDWQIALRLAVCAACGGYGFLYLPLTLSVMLRWPGVLGTALAAWCLVTAPLAVSQTYAGTSSVALLCVVLFAPAVLRALGGRRVVLTIVTALVLFLGCSWVVYFAVPELGRTEFVTADLEVIQRVGGLAHANGLGRQAALALAILLALGCERQASWRRLWPLLGLAGLTLVAAGSKTAMLAALAAAALLFCRRLGPRLMLALGCLFGAPIALAAISWEVDTEPLLALLARSGDAQEVYSLTGRTELWSHVVAEIGNSPLLGYGHGCARFVIMGFGLDWANYHAHNVWLNVLLCTGLVGGGLLAAMMVYQLWSLCRRPDSFPDVVTLLVLVGGIADCVMLNPIPDSHTLIWLIALVWRPMGASMEATPTLPLVRTAP